MNVSRTTLVIGVIALLLVAPASVPAAGQDLVTLTVTVDDSSGDAVKGAALTATWSNGSTTATTSANGKAFLDVEEGANVTIEVDHPDYTRNDPVLVEDAAQEDVRILVYDRASATIHVQDSEGRVSDATVRLYKHGRAAVYEQTEFGEIETGVIEAGEYTVIVQKPGYLTKQFSMEFNGTSTKTIEVERGTITLHFNVTDPHFDPPRPVNGVAVSVQDVGSVQTQSNGQQQLNVPVNTDLHVTFEKQSYNTVERDIHTNESEKWLNVSLDRKPAIDLTVFSDQIVVGEEVSLEAVNEYDEPVIDATVTLDGESVATTDVEGRADITIQEEGNHTIQVSKKGVASEPTKVKGVVARTPTTNTTITTTTATQSPTTTEEGLTVPSEVPVPGFTPVAAILALLAVIGLVGLRRRS